MTDSKQENRAGEGGPPTGARTGGREDPAGIAAARPVLQTVARLIATDRRAVVLASESGEILLANQPASRLGLGETGQGGLARRLKWDEIRGRARRAGSAPVSMEIGDHALEGELVHLALGPADGYLLRLSENDHEATWLRNRARSATLMRVAHDLRTPIQSLLATAERALGEDDGDPDRAREDRARMRRAADLTLDHINNVLAVIRGEQSVAGLLPDEDFRIAEELRNILAMIAPIAENRGTELRLEIEGGEDLWLHGPLRFVRALCQNMIDNAVKHGGRQVDVRLHCAPLSPEVLDPEDDADRWSLVLEVRDLGGGLPPGQKARLDEALGRAPAGAAQGADAQGGRRSAGLNVMAHALRQLGARLEVLDRGPDGEPTDGDRVTGTILRAHFSLPAVRPERAELSASAEAERPLAGRMILVVEDSPSSRDWLTHVLRGAGAEVIAAPSGQDALALLEQAETREQVSAVLSDVTLPGMTGIDFTRRLRAPEAGGGLDWQKPVVGLTAHVDARIRAACLKAGMARVLEKPVRSVQLCAAMAETLSASGRAVSEVRETKRPGGPVLDPQTTDDLLAEFGPEGARRYMGRAREEAQAARDMLLADDAGPEIRQLLHAATGAAGMTGLARLERGLRALELAVEAEDGDEIARLLAELDRVLEATERAIGAVS